MIIPVYIAMIVMMLPLVFITSIVLIHNILIYSNAVINTCPVTPVMIALISPLLAVSKENHKAILFRFNHYLGQSI